MYARLLTAWLGLAGFLCLGVVEAADKSLKETPSNSKSLKEGSSTPAAKKLGDAPEKKMGKRELQQQKFKAWLLSKYDKNKNGKMDENERQVRLRDLRNQREKEVMQAQAAQMRSMGRMGRMHHRRW